MSTYPRPFGRYQLLERLAIGGMAELFRAQARGAHGFERTVVIKRILPHLAADERFTTMFINEAKITAQLSHPKIAQTYELGTESDQLFIAMEYVDGLDALALLRELAHQQQKMPAELAVYVVQEVADALDFAHKQTGPEGEPLGIVHRDVSPSNVLMSTRGDVKLVDFGIAQAVQQEHHTKSGTLKGKYGYMSPEQVVGGDVQPTSDIFAAGIVLAEMLMGRRLFAAPNELDVLLMVRDVNLSRLDRFGSDLPAELMDIVRRCLRKDPRERYREAAELRDTLGDWLYQRRQRMGPRDVAELVGKYLDQARFRQRASLEDAAADAAIPAGVDEPTGIPVGAAPSMNSSLDIEISELVAIDEAAGGYEEPIDAEAVFAESEALRPDAVVAAVEAADIVDISIPVAKPTPVAKAQPQPESTTPAPPSAPSPAAASAPAPTSEAKADADFFDLGDLDDVDLKSATERSVSQPLPSPPAPAPTPKAAAPAGASAPQAAVRAEAAAEPAAARSLSDEPESVPIVVGQPVETPFQRARSVTRPPVATEAARARRVTTLPARPAGRGQGAGGIPSKSSDESLSSRYDSIEAAVASLALPDPDPSAKDFDDRDITEYPRSSIKKQMRAKPPVQAMRSEVAPKEPEPLRDISQVASITGSFRETPALRVLHERIASKDTGLLAAEVGGIKKEIYFVDGRPEFVSSNVSSELFGNYLISEGIISSGELDMALAMMPHYDGKLGDTLVGLGLVRPLDVFRHLTRQVRKKLVDVCTWQQGSFCWYPGRRNSREAFPLDLDPYEVLGAGALGLTPMFLQEWLETYKHETPRLSDSTVDPEAFQIPDIRSALARLDGTSTIMEHCARIADPRERGRFVRILYLALNVDLAGI